MTARTRHVAAQIQQWLRRRLSPADAYRPERHYMRGPGPKWLAKAGGQISETAKAAPKESKA